MKKVKFSQDLGITIIKKRLLTQEEAIKHKNKIPNTSELYSSRSVSYMLNPEDMPNGDFEEIGVLCYSDGQDKYSCVALELLWTDKKELEIGEKLIFEGKFYTLLEDNLAASSYFAMNFVFD